MRDSSILYSSIGLVLLLGIGRANDPLEDSRNIAFGHEIPNEGYCDQPYIVTAASGAWVCVMTTGPGKEGDLGQHVVATRSTDRGATWSKLVDIEPSTGPEASWAVPLITPNNRIYVFYDFNGDQIREMNGKKIRADMLGWYVFRFSDDEGRTWSEKRYRLPVRVTACDRSNDWKGKVQIFWGICEPVTNGKEVVFSFTKLGRYMLDQGEGWLFQSPNILTETNPDRLIWNMWPESDHGIRNSEFGSIQEEHNVVWIGPHQLYSINRTTLGFPCESISNDGGRTWSVPRPLKYASTTDQIVRTPRACPRIWKTREGNYLLWFHNHGGKSFQDRNPAWISGGILKDGGIQWSQPEILLYDDNPSTRMSYPDLVEDQGEYYFAETNKEVARIHHADRAMIQSLWQQGMAKEITPNPLIELRPGKALAINENENADLPLTGGLTIEAWVDLPAKKEPTLLLSSKDDRGNGFELTWSDNQTIQWKMSDGTNSANWESDPIPHSTNKRHHIVAIADAGPKIMMFVIDGRLHDGNGVRSFGWGRWTAPLHRISTSPTTIAEDKVLLSRIYGKALRVSQAIANFNAGP